MRRSNVVGVGVGHKIKDGVNTHRKAICVLVKEKKPLAELPTAHAIPLSLGGYETDVIEVGQLVALQDRLSKLRPAPPGCSIGHYLVTAGTLGCLVKDRSTGARLILSNNHVLANMTDGTDGRASTGDQVFQPGKYDNGTQDDVIGRLERWIPIYRDSANPGCPVAAAAERAGNKMIKMIRPNYHMKFFRVSAIENMVDAAVARPTSETVVMPEIIGIGIPAGVSHAQIGARLQKSGRTSGLTAGEVMVIGATLQVMMGDLGFATFHDQIVTSAMAEPGDSGSLVLDESRKAVGLLGAGSDKATILSSIQNVLDLLDVDLVTS
jgi:hypothetical protein